MQELEYLFVRWECASIQPVLLANKLERRNNQSHPPLAKLTHYYFALQYTRAEVGAYRKINVQHHDVVRPGVEASDVPPEIELALERIQNEMDVHVFRHVWVGRIDLMEHFEYFIAVSDRFGRDVNSNRYRSCYHASQCPRGPKSVSGR